MHVFCGPQSVMKRIIIVTRDGRVALRLRYLLAFGDLLEPRDLPAAAFGLGRSHGFIVRRSISLMSINFGEGTSASVHAWWLKFLNCAFGFTHTLLQPGGFSGCTTFPGGRRSGCEGLRCFMVDLLAKEDRHRGRVAENDRCLLLGWLRTSTILLRLATTDVTAVTLPEGSIDPTSAYSVPLRFKGFGLLPDPRSSVFIRGNVLLFPITRDHPITRSASPCLRASASPW